jgi:hypothetical protein
MVLEEENKELHFYRCHSGIERYVHDQTYIRCGGRMSVSHRTHRYAPIAIRLLGDTVDTL